MAPTTPPSPSSGAGAVDDYLAAQPSPQRQTLQSLRATLRSILPVADETIKYGMPAFVLDGQGVAGYAGFAAHCGYFPHSSSVLIAAGDAVSHYETSKGGLRFSIDKPLPVALVRKLVALRLAEFDGVTNGTRRTYFRDGRLKAIGKMKDGQLQGNWAWYRADGSLMRRGRFDRGEPVGTWQTFDRDGGVVSITKR